MATKNLLLLPPTLLPDNSTNVPRSLPPCPFWLSSAVLALRFSYFLTFGTVQDDQEQMYMSGEEWEIQHHVLGRGGGRGKRRREGKKKKTTTHVSILSMCCR